MKRNARTSGFAVVEVVIIVVTIAIISGVGWYIWQGKQSDSPDVNTTKSAGTNNSETKTFKSTELGMSFVYPWEFGDVMTDDVATQRGQATGISFSGNYKFFGEVHSNDWLPSQDGGYGNTLPNLCEGTAQYIVYKDDNTCVAMLATKDTENGGYTADLWIQKYSDSPKWAEVWFTGSPVAAKDESESALKAAYDNTWAKTFDAVAFAKSISVVE